MMEFLKVTIVALYSTFVLAPIIGRAILWNETFPSYLECLGFGFAAIFLLCCIAWFFYSFVSISGYA